MGFDGFDGRGALVGGSIERTTICRRRGRMTPRVWGREASLGEGDGDDGRTMVGNRSTKQFAGILMWLFVINI